MDKTIVVPSAGQPYFLDKRPSSDYVTYSSDVRYPSKYKQLKSFTLNWQTRLILEAAASPAMFVTLTFDDEHYDVDDSDPEIRKANLKRSWQTFMKRFRNHLLRDLHDNTPFKYYAISERGDDGRLHFHALIYGFPYTTFPGKNAKGQRILHISYNLITECMQDSWGNGFLYFEAAVPENCKYVVKYLHKRKISGDYISLKSNGLGMSFFTESRQKFIRESKATTYVVSGKTYYLPRYIKQKIYNEEELREVNAKIEVEKHEKELKKAQLHLESSLCKSYFLRLSDVGVYKLLEACKDDIRFGIHKDPQFGVLFASQFEHLNVQYDPGTDDIVILTEVSPENHYLWLRCRERVLDNYRIKSVFNKRL